MKTLLTVAATLALAVGTGFVVAQTTPTNAPPATNPLPTDTPPPADNPTQPRANNMPTMGRQGMAPMAPDFSTLDRNGVGYITRQDAAGNPWLEKNFQTCDADRDGQITRSEYMICAKSR
ncbi:MAG TPA: hypothetical protein VJ696_11270 [Rhodanobacteraceae bacterium]|nr:hypothetical protein [Rhodanobacteraceae bacterium]